MQGMDKPEDISKRWPGQVLTYRIFTVRLPELTVPGAIFETRKVEGTDNVYVFRFGSHQSMFVVTPDGVIATDPIGYGRPHAVTTYIDEIKKVTNKPIKYLIYSHHHYDHIAGGQPFKDAGATIIAHKRAKERLEIIKDPATPLPDEVMDKRKTIRLGGTTLELSYHGLNHSDSTIVMRLPKEILALDWERMIPGHPGPGGRLGTKADVQDQLTFLQDASEAVKIAAREGKCWEPAEKEVTLPKYEKWPGYQANLQFVLRRYCGLWERGT